MAVGGRFQISAHQSTGRFYGALPSGVGSVPGQQPPANDSLAIGTLVANPTTDNGAWPMADLVKMSHGWSDNGGTGNAIVNEQEHVTIDGTRELQRPICYDFLQTFPRVGTYTVFRTGTADLRVLAGGVDSGWQSTDSWTFTAAPSQSISLYVRSPDGNSATLTGASIVHSDDVAAFQADSDALHGGWLSYIRDDMQSPIVRNLLPHEVFEDEFARRTTPQSLSYVSVLDRSNFLQDENGSRHSTFSLEIQCKMVNQIGASTFYWNIPPHATDDWVLQAATLIQATLNPGIRVAIALTNESWNTAFWYNAQVIRTIHIAKTTFGTTPGSNTWTSTAHGFTNGQNIACIVSPNSARQAGSGPYHASGDAYPAPVLTRMQVTNATANTFDVVLASDGTTPLPAPTGVTEVYAWLESAYDLDGANYNTQVDHAHGLRSSQIFDVAVPVFSGRTTVRLIETQSDFISRTLERLGPNGADGNYDAISIGAYYNAADVWQVGDTAAQMGADGIVAAENVIQAGIVGHIQAGEDSLVPHIKAKLIAENIWTYEAGPHWLAVLGTNGTQQQREDAFEAFASTQEMANTEEYFYGRCQELGLRNMVITSPDLYIFGSSGTWGSKSELYLPDIPRTTLYKSWNGYIEPQAADVTAPTIALNGQPVINVATGGSYTDEGATYNDNVDGTGQVFANMTGVDFNTPGTYTLTYSYTDQAGNGPSTVTRDIVVADAVSVTNSNYFIHGHSLSVHSINADVRFFDVTAYTNVGEWFGLLAQTAGNTAVGAYYFGQLEQHNALNWADINSLDANGSFTIGNTSPYGSGYANKNFTHHYFMPSNYLQEDMGGPPFSNAVTTTQGRAETLIDNINLYYPGSEKILYIHWPDTGPYSGQENMSRATFIQYNNDTMGNYLTWHINLQDAMAANGYTIRSFPLGPVIAWLLENESYLTALNYSDLYADGSGHGSENIYFLGALVMFRCIYGSSADISSFVFPGAATQIISQISSNLSAIDAAVITRLNYHNSNGLSVF